MRIALAIEHFDAAVGGREAYAVTVVRELLARGHEVLITAEDGDATVCDDAVLHLGPLADSVDRWVGWRPDVTLDWGLNVPANLHRLGGGIHSEYLRIVMEGLPPLSRILKRLEILLSRKHARAINHETNLLSYGHTHVLAVSRFVAEQARRVTPVQDNRIHVLHNGVNSARFDPERGRPWREAVRRDLNLTKADVVFLFVGHNLKLKNLGLIKRVFDHLHPACPRLRLVVLGKRDPGIKAPWFRYAPATKTPERIYAACDALLHPTLYDACANVVLEAMASGLPVVSSDRNGSAELIDLEKTGFVLPVVGPDTLTCWIDMVRRLVEDQALRRTIGGNAADVARTWTIESYVDRLETILTSIATGPST